LIYAILSPKTIYNECFIPCRPFSVELLQYYFRQRDSKTTLNLFIFGPEDEKKHPETLKNRVASHIPQNVLFS